MSEFFSGGPKAGRGIEDEKREAAEGVQEFDEYRIGEYFNKDGLDPEVAAMTKAEIMALPVEKMYPKKIVTWEAVRNIINSLTNQLYIARTGDSKLDLSLAYISNVSAGGRKVKASGVSGVFGVKEFTWNAYSADQIESIDFSSGSSGSRLVAEKIGDDWEIQYIPPNDVGEDGRIKEFNDGYGNKINRFYQGAYFSLYALGDSVKNIDENYVNGERP